MYMYIHYIIIILQHNYSINLNYDIPQIICVFMLEIVLNVLLKTHDLLIWECLVIIDNTEIILLTKQNYN